MYPPVLRHMFRQWHVSLRHRSTYGCKSILRPKKIDAVRVSIAHISKKEETINQQVLKLDANEASAQMLQNALRVSHKKIDRVMGIWRSRSGIWRSSVCMATVWSQAVQENPIQIIYQHLSIWLRIPTGKVFVFCFGVSQKSASMVQWGIA
jgi:hypothetical protein